MPTNHANHTVISHQAIWKQDWPSASPELLTQQLTQEMLITSVDLHASGLLIAQLDTQTDGIQSRNLAMATCVLRCLLGA